jgi:hypothetical protein
LTSARPRFDFSGRHLLAYFHAFFDLGGAEVLFLHFAWDVIFLMEIFEGISVPLIPFGGGPA